MVTTHQSILHVLATHGFLCTIQAIGMIWVRRFETGVEASLVGLRQKGGGEGRRRGIVKWASNAGALRTRQTHDPRKKQKKEKEKKIAKKTKISRNMQEEG